MSGTATDVLVRQRTVPDAEDARRRDRFPVGAALTFDDLEAAGHEDRLDDLRAREPVSWVPVLGGWLVTGWDAARTVLRARQPVTVEAHENLVRASLGRMMLTVDGPEHVRLRRPFDAPFKRDTSGATFGPVAEEEAVTLLAALRPRGRMEVGKDFAAPFAVGMAGHALGLDLGDVRRIDRFYAAFAGAMVYDGDPAPQALADTARAELDAILHGQLDRVRRTPSPSITSLVARADGGLADDEIVAQLRVIMFGAVETIQASIMTTLLLLLRHPDQLAAVRAAPDLLAAAGEEARRLVPPVAFAERWTRAPLTVDGVEIPADEFVGLSILAANRDPRVFPDPTRFDVRRPAVGRALTWSFGPHTCLGLHLARLETTVAVRRLLELPGLALTAVEEPAGFAFRRSATLHVTWDG